MTEPPRMKPRVGWKPIVVGLMVVGVIAALVVLLAYGSAALRDALVAVGGLIAALATATAAYFARSAAVASSDSARHARLALALHNRPWPFVHLTREGGRPDAAWMWYVKLGQGEAAANLRLSWAVDGAEKSARRDRLAIGELWETGSFVDASLSAAELHRRVHSVRITWKDQDRLVLWRSVVEIKPEVGEGQYVPYSADGEFFEPCQSPHVTYGTPEVVW